MHAKESKSQSPEKATNLWQTLRNLIQITHFLQQPALKQILDKQHSRSILTVSFLIWNARQYVYHDSP